MLYSTLSSHLAIWVILVTTGAIGGRKQEPTPPSEILCAQPRLVECGPIEESENCGSAGIGCLFHEQLQIWDCNETYLTEAHGGHIPNLDVQGEDRFWLSPVGEPIVCFTTHTCVCPQNVANPVSCYTLVSYPLEIQPYVGTGSPCADF